MHFPLPKSKKHPQWRSACLAMACWLWCCPNAIISQNSPDFSQTVEHSYGIKDGLPDLCAQRVLLRYHYFSLDSAPPWLLASSKAAGRDYVLLASDELFPKCFNTHNPATWHILGILTSKHSEFGYGKLGTYAHWNEDIEPLLPHDEEEGALKYQEEYYPYDVVGGMDEITNYAKDEMMNL